jgi:hypothetical protein
LIRDVEFLVCWGDWTAAARDEEIGQGMAEHAAAAGDED